MKAEELMIGDWVCVTKNFTQKYHRIRALSNDENDVAKGTYINNYGVECNSIFSRNDIEPIPLTPEILEKNGWEKRPTGYVFYTDGKRYDNSLWYIFGSNTFVVNTAEFQIKYVHQLQHALRLCGIEKTIEL